MAFGQLRLDIKDADIERGGEPVLCGLTLCASSGEALQFFGGNGCGKSSLLQAIAGLVPLAAGEIHWSSAGASGDGVRLTPEMTFVGHETPAKLTLSGRENLRFWARIYGVDNNEMVTDMLGQAGLSAAQDIPVHRYSAGQRRRLDLARALIAARPVWLLDEPTASLDRDGVEAWTGAIAAHQERGGLALIASHDRLELRSRNVRLG